MNVDCKVNRRAAAHALPARRSSPLELARLIALPLSLTLWAVGVSETNTGSLGPYGLPAALPPVFYAGLALLIASAGIEFSRPVLSPPRLALHAVALAVILYGTAPLVYTEGRYAWLYKTIGVVRYVGAHGSLDRSIDIYQSWPGFFALAAWFDKAAGVGSPLAYAKWAQLAFELAAIPLLYTIYHALGLPVWHRWMAIMLQVAANWIAQDYFSPQGMSTLLSLGVMAVAARWMLVAGTGGERWRGAGSADDQARAARPRAMGEQLRSSGPFLLILVFLFCVLTASHELSPYIVVIQLASLSVIGVARPRLVAAALAVIAVAYLLPSFAYVNSHYGLSSSLGSFFSNIQPPSAANGTAFPESQRIIADCARILSAGIWLLALAGAWISRKSGTIVLALLLLTFSPVLVLLAGAYGNEGLLRVYLFSLPWAVALAACALAPVRGYAVRGDAGRGALRSVIPLALAVALFFPAFFGNDASNVMTSSEVNTVLAFLQSAKPGPLLAVLDNLPASDTADYNKFAVGTVLDINGIAPRNQAVSDLPAYVARTMGHYYPGEPAYIVMTPSMSAYNTAYGITSPRAITALLAGLAKSPYWELLASSQGTEIYRLSAAASTLPAGSYAGNVELAVP